MLIINTLIARHTCHPFSRNPGVSRDTLRGGRKSEYEPIISISVLTFTYFFVPSTLFAFAAASGQGVIGVATGPDLIHVILPTKHSLVLGAPVVS